MGIRYAESDDFEDEFEDLDAEAPVPDFRLDDRDIEAPAVPPSGKRRKWRSVEEYQEWKRLSSQLDDYDIDLDS